jgi:tol-pal system protein YbgF
MSSRFSFVACVAAMAAMLAAAPQASAQSGDVDPEMRVQQLENQLRQLTGQNEELQYRNRQLEERLRQMGTAPAPGQAAVAAQPNVAAIPAQPGPARQSQMQQQPATDQQIAAPAPIVQEPPPQAQGRRRGDAFDPGQSPNAPGAPRALGGGQLPIANDAVGAPGGRGAGEPLDLANTAGSRDPGGSLPPPPRDPGATAALTTLPPSATPRDEFDLGIGYMQRKDYALAEETMRNFAQKYPADPLLADSQYWLGESFFQRQLYRDSAEAFLAVTTKFDKSAKAPDALLRLGQSLAALKEKEAACAALGEVTRKYPRASNGVKQAVDREQKRVKC